MSLGQQLPSTAQVAVVPISGMTEQLLLLAGNQKAEIIGGELHIMSPTGGAPGNAGDEIYASLRAYAKRTGRGRAIGDNKAFMVNLLNRQSFSPDAAFYIGPDPGMKFYQGAPVFAVEVRSQSDYGPAAEQAIRDKRWDYFAAGTQIVWDVDLLSEIVIKSYTILEPDQPVLFRRADTAHAEPVLPGWQIAVADLFSS
jgi:Uma2 family endonuclease